MKQLKTQLLDRELRFDGVSVLHPDLVAEALLRGAKPSQLRVTEMSEDVELFNDNSDDPISLDVNEPVKLDFSWQLPDQYLNMDLRGTIVARAVDRLIKLNYPEDVHLAACERIQAEFEEIERRGMVEFMKTIIYVLDIFQEKGIIWGVGRGSSCACYILFILGLHSVDCIKYDVPMEEFFHD